MKKNILCGILAAGLLLGSVQAAESGFTDVTDSDWFAPYVSVCVENGLMNGTGAGAFSPQGVITAGEVAAIAARLGESLNGEPIVYGTAAPGEKLPWYHWYVENLKSYGVTVAAPESPASRLEFISYLSAVTPQENLSVINSISSLPDTADSAVLSFYNAGILTGVDDYGTFSGNRTLTRSEAAAMVARLVNPDLRLPFTPKEKEATPPTSYAGDDVAMTVNGTPVSTAAVASWGCAMAYQLDSTLASYYQTRLDLTDPTMLQAVMEQARIQAAAQVLMEAKAAQLGCSPEDLPTALAPSPSSDELNAYVKENGLLCAKHILVTDEQTAKAVLDGLEAVSTLDQFNALLTIFGTDPGMESNPDGYLFGPGRMVQEFEAGTQALEIGSYSKEPVQSTYGYHIIWRLDPLDHPDLLPQYRNAILEDQVNGWLDSAEILVNEEALSQIDMAATYAVYLQTLSGAQ